MARTVGIDLRAVHLLTYAIGSAISAPAGILVAMDVGAEPFRGTRFVLLASVGVIMGGIGSIPGAMLGGLFLGPAGEPRHLEAAVRVAVGHQLRRVPASSSSSGRAASSAARSSPRRSDDGGLHRPLSRDGGHLHDPRRLAQPADGLRGHLLAGARGHLRHRRLRLGAGGPQAGAGLLGRAGGRRRRRAPARRRSWAFRRCGSRATTTSSPRSASRS